MLFYDMLFLLFFLFISAIWVRLITWIRRTSSNQQQKIQKYQMIWAYHNAQVLCTIALSAPQHVVGAASCCDISGLFMVIICNVVLVFRMFSVASVEPNFQRNGCLRRHVNCAHKDAAVADVCPLTRKSSKSGSYESSSTFKCPCCSKAFSNSTNLRRHAKNCHSCDPLKTCQVLISQKRGRGASINLPPSDTDRLHTEPEHLIETQSRELVLL